MGTLPLVMITSSLGSPAGEAMITEVAEVLDGRARYCVIEPPSLNVMAPLKREEENDLITKLADAEALLVHSGIITRRVILESRQLRIITMYGTGVDQIDVAAATEAGIMVTNVPSVNANAVAELAFGLLLALVRRIPQCSWLVQHEGKWEEAQWVGTELRGKTLGVVSCGNIGSRVVALANAFGMSVMAYDAYMSDQAVLECGATPADLVTVLSSSDIVTIHTPLNEQTRHLVGKNELASMKEGALLINTSRGSVVDEHALYQSLLDGHLDGAALDVMEQEPPAPNSPLMCLPNVVITSHMGGTTQEAYATTARVACEDILKALQGEVPEHCVNCGRLGRYTKMVIA